MLLTSLKTLMRGRPAPTAAPTAPPPVPVPAPVTAEGEIGELSAVHVSGWLRDPARPEQRMGYAIVLPDSGEVLARGRADQFWFGLPGDGACGFWARFPRPLPAGERARLEVRAEGGGALVRSPALIEAYEPLLHVAMDVVDNCNLRCPFCVFDYARTNATHFMEPQTLEAALRFLPYARDGEFWFSCLHEPALHPELMAFIERVPHALRRKLFFTTNLAKRMPQSYFDWLAGNGMHHINVSIESRDPDIYERMRKGARHRIFVENWDRLSAALATAARPTPVRYISMAYKSNLRELPELARYLLEERRAAQVEIRHTFDVPWIPPDFRAAEYLGAQDWAWLEAALAGFAPGQIFFVPPPPEHAAAAAQADPQPAPGEPGFLPGRVMFRLSWDGALRIAAIRRASRDGAALEHIVRETNIRDLPDPAVFFAGLEAMLAGGGEAAAA